jgi:hypothetical protein
VLGTVVQIAQIIGAAAAIVAAIAAWRAHEVVKEVKTEVKTANGITLAALSDRQEGRRIAADVPMDDRTSSEQHYVDRLDEGGH